MSRKKKNDFHTKPSVTSYCLKARLLLLEGYIKILWQERQWSDEGDCQEGQTQRANQQQLRAFSLQTQGTKDFTTAELTHCWEFIFV